jgi:hypothetical protein
MVSCQVAGATELAMSRLHLTDSRPGHRSWRTWPGLIRTKWRRQVTEALLTGIEIGSAICAFITVAFVVVARYFWRRGKPLREP